LGGRHDSDTLPEFSDEGHFVLTAQSGASRAAAGNTRRDGVMFRVDPRVPARPEEETRHAEYQWPEFRGLCTVKPTSTVGERIERK
jgi:hypothetical protein